MFLIEFWFEKIKQKENKICRIEIKSMGRFRSNKNKDSVMEWFFLLKGVLIGVIKGD